MDILDEIRKRVGCSVISDLKYDCNLEQAKCVLKGMDLKIYSFAQLKDVVLYLFGVNLQFSSKENIIEYIQNLE